MMNQNEIEVLPDTQGLIFDCDGTLTDSMAIHMKAWERAFGDFNEPYQKEFLDPLRGMGEEAIVELYNTTFKKDLDPIALVDQKHRYFLKEIDRVKPIPLVVDIVKRFANKKPMAVVSGGRRETVLLSLKIIGIETFFEAILTADDPFPPKPAPDVFLEAARRLDVDPKACQVFEDGDLGLEAAKKAGMAGTDVRPYL